jgi:hypothetical protein
MAEKKMAFFSGDLKPCDSAKNIDDDDNKREKKGKKKKKKKKKKKTTLKNKRNFSDIDNAEDVHEEELVVEGIMYNDTMYLLDKRSGIVYSGIRDTDGNLVRVGIWNSLDKNVVVDTTASGIAPQLYPFPVDTADHCETPSKAYEDVDVVLNALSKLMFKNELKQNRLIYDPYFCAGSIISNLNNLGYQNVYNKCENFYTKIEKKQIPMHDILITNPPYSSDHVEKLFQFVSTYNKKRSCFLLLPSYFCQRKYFKLFCEKLKLFFIVPSRRYRYRAPKGGRTNVRKDRKNAPFVSFWYCSLPVYTNDSDRKNIYKKISQYVVKYNIELRLKHEELLQECNNNSKSPPTKQRVSKKPRSLQFYENFNLLPKYLLNDNGSNKKYSNKRRKT